MIEIPRSMLRQFRLALKRSFPPRCRPHQKLWVVIEASKDKLAIRSMHTDAGVCVQLPAHHAPEDLAIPAQALDEVQGRDGSVTLERAGDKVIARFDDGGIPRVLEVESTDPSKLPSFPAMPTSVVTNPPAIIKALDNAMHCAAVDSVRYATCKIQMRGSGEIVVTDGRQLLMQGGWKFVNADTPLLCREAQRLFVWMPLPKQSCIAADPQAVVIHGSNGKPDINHERRKPVPRRNGKHVTPPKVEPAAVKPTGLGSLIEEARELRSAMRGMFARSRSLLSALQLHRRKARIVDSTLASLKKLQTKVQ